MRLPSCRVPALLLMLYFTSGLGTAMGASSAPAGWDAVTSMTLGSGSCCADLDRIGFHSDLPIVIVQWATTSLLTKENKTPVFLCTCNSGSNFTDIAEYGTAKVHGNSSAKFAKQSLKVDFKSRNGTSSVSASLLGMPKADAWILYGGDQVDLTTGMRDFVAYNAARASGEYATRTVYCEVFEVPGGEALALKHYHGVFIGEEPVERGKNRVDIASWSSADPSGGYLLVFSHSNFNASSDTLVMPAENFTYPFVLKYPTKKADKAAAASWIRGYIDTFQAALFGDGWLSADAGYAQYLDGPTWVDYFLISELTKSPDSYRDSTYLHKDRDKPLAAGPAWDYNEAFGECCGYPIQGYAQNGRSGPGVAGGSAISPAGWRFMICADPDRCVADPSDGISFWYRRMWNDTRFRTGVAARWKDLRAGPWADSYFTTLIDNTTDLIRVAAARDLKLYAAVLDKPWYPSPTVQWNTEVANLRSWTLQRLAWMDAALELAGSPQYTYPGTNITVPGVSNGAAPTSESAAG